MSIKSSSHYNINLMNWNIVILNCHEWLKNSKNNSSNQVSTMFFPLIKEAILINSDKIPQEAFSSELVARG